MCHTLDCVKAAIECVRRMSRITLRDVAEHVGVDRSTVSRVLSNKAAEGKISAAMAARIMDAARSLNYIPNTSARAIKVGRFGCAALLMSTVSGRSYLPSRLLDGIHDELAAADMHLTVAKVPDEKLHSPDYVPKILRSLTADGLLINYTNHLPAELVDMVDRGAFPAVWINTRREANAVYPQNFEAGRQATERLLAAGHTRIAYVDMCVGREELGAEHFSVTDRLEGYVHAMRAAGLRPWEIRPPRACDRFEKERAYASEILNRPDRPTAIVGYFAIFIPSLLRAAGELGIRVPTDLSIVTFAPGDGEQRLTVSAMLEPHYRMGRDAVAMLRSRIGDPGGSVPSRRLAFHWQDAGTCVPPSEVTGRTSG